MLRLEITHIQMKEALPNHLTHVVTQDAVPSISYGERLSMFGNDVRSLKDTYVLKSSYVFSNLELNSSSNNVK